MKHDSNTFLLSCIYGPNEECPNFYTDLFLRIANFNIPESILIGDFNVTLNHDVDNLNYAAPRNVRTRNNLNSLISDYSYTDIF